MKIHFFCRNIFHSIHKKKCLMRSFFTFLFLALLVLSGESDGTQLLIADGSDADGTGAVPPNKDGGSRTSPDPSGTTAGGTNDGSAGEVTGGAASDPEKRSFGGDAEVHSPNKNKIVATPEVEIVDREMANPLTPLEISERLRNFAENLNVYMQKLSLAGIVAAEAATRVQVQASLAELALLALEQVDQIHKMQSDVTDKIKLTLTALSNVVTNDSGDGSVA